MRHSSGHDLGVQLAPARAALQVGRVRATRGDITHVARADETDIKNFQDSHHDYAAPQRLRLSVSVATLLRPPGEVARSVGACGRHPRATTPLPPHHDHHDEHAAMKRTRRRPISGDVTAAIKKIKDKYNYIWPCHWRRLDSSRSQNPLLATRSRALSPGSPPSPRSPGNPQRHG